MAQKIVRIGTSVGIIIPKPSAERFGFAVGKEVEPIEKLETGEYTIKLKERPVIVSKKIISPAVIEWTDAFIEENRGLLERLKNE